MVVSENRGESRDYDIGHGTRMGFRVASVFAFVVALAFVAWFVFGPTNVQTENPPAGDTQIEKQVAPPKQDVSPTSPAATPAPAPAPSPTAP